MDRLNEQDSSRYTEGTSEYLPTAAGDNDSLSFEYPKVTVNPLYPPIYNTLSSKQAYNEYPQDPRPISKSPPSVYSDAYRDIKTNMVEARIVAADKEVELLSKALSREKTVSTALRSQLRETLEKSGEALRQQSSTKPDDVHTNASGRVDQKGNKLSTSASEAIQQVQEFLEKYMGDFPPDSSPLGEGDPRNRLVKAANDLRKSARSLLSKYRDLLLEGKTSARDADVAMKLKSEVSHLKEEVLRKSSLISSLKTAKAAESKALEQWKTEFGKIEETAKR